MGLDRKKLMWLASYPKSGNTWLRIFLANYFLDAPNGEKLSLAEITRTTRGDAQHKPIELAAGRPVSELTPAELLQARESYLAEIADFETPTFVKTHQANAIVHDISIIPPQMTRCAVYVVRNPLDIVASFSDHMGLTIDKATDALARKGFMLQGSEKQIAQFLDTWSMHVRSWFSAEGFPVQILRYEDMLDEPEKNFGSVLETLCAPYDRTKLLNAIDASSFKKLVEQEDQDEFVERSEKQERFFRSGKKDVWQDTLPGHIIDKIRADHGEAMKALKYM